LNEKIDEDLKTAIKARDTMRISCLRMLKASVKITSSYEINPE